jgi:hypothetical protein
MRDLRALRGIGPNCRQGPLPKPKAGCQGSQAVVVGGGFETNFPSGALPAVIVHRSHASPNDHVGLSRIVHDRLRLNTHATLRRNDS